MERVRIFSQDANVSGCTYIDVYDPEIVRGWWSDLKNQAIDTANLEDRVRFNIETSDCPDNQIIKLQLFDRDMLSPDDDIFCKKQVFQDIKVVGNKAHIDFELPVSWEQDILDEPIVNRRTIYWKANIGKKTIKIDSHLDVFLSNRTLYVMPSPNDDRTPQLYTSSGEELIVVELVAGQLIDRIPIATDFAVKHIALAKLEKGYMATNTGKVYTNSRQTYTVQYFTEDNLIVKTRQGHNFGYLAKNGTSVTTKGINQYAFFSNTGSSVKLLGMLKSAGPIYDVFNILKFGMSEDNTQSLPIPLPGIGVLNCMVDNLVCNYETGANGIVIENMQAAKKQGLMAVRALVDAKSHVKKGVWYELLNVSKETANKILLGEIRTYNDMRKLAKDSTPEVALLYRFQTDNIKKSDICIIETFYLLSE